MSTGADAKTMPVTAAYANEHERIFGERERPTGERRLYVMRCSACDGVQHDPCARLYMCPKCRAWTCASMDAAIAPALQEAPRSSLDGIASGRFYENQIAIDGKTDIGSRGKYREYLKETGYTHSSDFSPEYIANVKKRREEADSKATRETVERVWYERWKP